MAFKLARWDKIVEYFNLLDRESDKIQVSELGLSTEGNPILLVIISSAENMKNLDRFKEINAQLADPRGLNESQVEALVKEWLAYR